MWRALFRKIHEIRNADEDTKKTWLVLASGVTITFVVVMWIFYIRWAILPAKQIAKETRNETGFWEIMKTGAFVTGKNIYHEIGALVTQLRTEKTITITE